MTITADARAAHAAATRGYRLILLIGVLVALLALAGVALLNRLVTRPLAEVARRARQISAGSLVPGTAVGGPREVRAVASAFDDLMGNLRLIQAQADALARGNTGHDALRRRAPGPLGQAMRASVDRLTHSLQARDRLENQLRHESTHDALTGLLNRAAALVALDQGLARINRAGRGLGVIQLDLDRFQVINDLAGQEAGDAVLRAAAGVITGVVRSEDVVARLGSDDFVVIAETDSFEQLMELAQRLVTGLAGIPLPGILQTSTGRAASGLPAGLPPATSACAGVAVAFDGLADSATLMRDAASAVRAAKGRGGGQIEVLDDELRSALEHRLRIADGLRTALANGDLRLHYQPIVDMNGVTIGAESLCRWTSAELGVMRPDIFVEVAEASDLVLDLDRWVLAEATRQLAAWDAAGELPGLYLSVNVSGRHLDGHDLVGDVTRALEREGIDPHRLLLEITETVLLSDLHSAARQLSELRALGVRVAVDDFGTGYTSISHLQQLPVDVVKIDRSFIVGMTDERGRALVQMMIEMAQVLGLAVVAEGVESPEELEQLRAMGCSLVQGYLTGRPGTPEVLAASPVSPPATSPVVTAGALMAG